MKILILNTHSTLNAGDTGIVLAQVRLFRRLFPGVEISLTSRTPRLDRAFYAPRGIKVHSPFTPAPGVFDGGWEKLRGSIGNLVDLAARRDLLAAIRESDLVISSGGGYFYSYGKRFPGPTFLQYYLHLQLARARSKPVIFFPQSFGPFANPPSARLCRSILAGGNVRKVLVREKISRDLLLDLLGDDGGEKVAYCPDAVFLLEPAESRPAADFASRLRRPVLALTLRDWHFPGAGTTAAKAAARENYLSSLIEVASSFRKRFGGEVLVVPQVRGPDPLENDTAISREFVRRYRRENGGEGMSLIPDRFVETPEDIIALFSRVDLVVATRFHSAVFALLARTPAITVAYQHKAAGMLRELGLERFLVEIGGVSSGKILDLVEELMGDLERWRENISGRVAASRRMVIDTLEGVLAGIKNENTAG